MKNKLRIYYEYAIDTIKHFCAGHKNHHLDRWANIVNLYNFKEAKRKKISPRNSKFFMTCAILSINFRLMNENKVYRGLFARRDRIPEDFHEDSDEPDIPELVLV